MSKQAANPLIPMVSHAMLLPFLRRYEEAAGSAEPILAKFGIDAKRPASDMLPSIKAWEFIEEAAASLSNPAFGFEVGSETPFPELPNLARINQHEMTLGHRLSALIVDAPRLTNQASYSLDQDSNYAVLERKMLFSMPAKPSQSDGFLAGMLLQFIQKHAGEFWSPELVLLSVCEKSAIPASVLPRTSIVTSSEGRFVLRFPTAWLLLTERSVTSNKANAQNFDLDLVSAVKSELRKNIQDPALNLPMVASKFSVSPRSVQLALSEAGQSYRQLLSEIRLNTACDLLENEDSPVAEIGRQVGYETSSSFVRAFSNKFGISPLKFRKAKAQVTGRDG